MIKMKALTVGGIVGVLLLVGGLSSTASEKEDPLAPEGKQIAETEDGEFRFLFDGRLFLDAAFYDDDRNDLSSGTEVRRARIAFKGLIHTDWRFELDFDVMDEELDVEDMWLGYGGFDRTLLKVGQFKEPFGLEKQTSSKYTTFMERSLPTVLVPKRSIGAGIHRYADRWTVAGGIFGQGVEDDSDREDREGSDGYAVTARATFSPVHGDGRILHLGLAGTYRTPDATERSYDYFRFRTEPETHVDRARFLDTGRIRDVDDKVSLGLEAAGVWGPFSLQGEYMQTKLSRTEGLNSTSLDGFYLFASWFITGESRNYLPAQGEFGRSAPGGKRGSLELALRYSSVDLNDEDSLMEAGEEDLVLGGEADQWTLGLNWRLNPYIRIMGNLSRVDHDEFADEDGDLVGDDDFSIFQLRFQLNF